jgi:hypothetical protein
MEGKVLATGIHNQNIIAVLRDKNGIQDQMRQCQWRKFLIFIVAQASQPFSPSFC